MFYLNIDGTGLLYTGDFCPTSPDRHLGAYGQFELPTVPIDLLIMESTYATTIKAPRLKREADFIDRISNCIEDGGKVLIPAFAMGRSQEICHILGHHWRRMGLSIPIYVSSERTVHSKNDIFRLVSPEDQDSVLEHAGPLVLIASPGMLHSGFSLQALQAWAPDPKNLILLPGYCAPGTVGSALLQGTRQIRVGDHGKVIRVRMQVQTMAMSAHADLHGLVQLISLSRPGHVVLVHGDKETMLQGKAHMETLFPEISCHCPPNGSILDLEITDNQFIKSSKMARGK
jgi:integrator complex subunit 11